ncbi:MAG TPA: ABC-2 family transporter protein [Acidimicrobiales bacterium]|nr:ABC-2 family transporter protein [Acidimicrobiales bacterium]
MGELAIYRRLVGARIRADLQYRTSFFLFLASQTLVAGLDLAVILVLFTQVSSIGGWSAPEVALLYGLAGTGFGLADLFASEVELASRHIKAGTFDLFLLRPAGALLQLCATEFAPRRIGRLVQPLIVIVVVLGRVDISWTPAKVVLIPVAILSGAVIFSAIWVITSSVSFWTVETQEVSNSFTYGGLTLSQYPIDVFGTWLRRMVTFVLPLAFVSYFPAAYLLDKPVAFGLPSSVALLAPVVAIVLVFVARAVWQLAVRHYRSTGS